MDYNYYYFLTILGDNRQSQLIRHRNRNETFISVLFYSLKQLEASKFKFNFGRGLFIYFYRKVCCVIARELGRGQSW